MTDKYDRAIAYLTENPGRIEAAWMSGNPHNEHGSALFAFATESGNVESDDDGNPCGCLTQVRDGASASTPELTDRIRSDMRIPARISEITVGRLSVFAEWQREFDSMFPGRSAEADDT